MPIVLVQLGLPDLSVRAAVPPLCFPVPRVGLCPQPLSHHSSPSPHSEGFKELTRVVSFLSTSSPLSNTGFGTREVLNKCLTNERISSTSQNLQIGFGGSKLDLLLMFLPEVAQRNKENEFRENSPPDLLPDWSQMKELVICD